ncbi:MAG: YceD family protein [Flammeovirgaceae bacterium]
MNDFVINILRLTKKQHSFQFKLNDEFFSQYGNQIVAKGDFDAAVILDKRETFIEAHFEIKGQAELICDRSLEPFNQTMNVLHSVVFKYGEQPGEVTDEIVMITQDQESIDVGQFIYEFIVLQIPIKKIHPRFQIEKDENSDDVESGKIVYQTEETEKTVDPRWEKLKKLK